MKRDGEEHDEPATLEARPDIDHDDGDAVDGNGIVPGAPLVVGVADRPSGVRRIEGGISKRFGKGKEPLDPLPPGAHWRIGDGGSDDLDRAGVSAIGCFYAKPEGFNRWRCFNRLTGFEHVTYHTRETLEEALLDQSKKWHEKLMPSARISPWQSGWGNSVKNKKAS